MFSLCRMIKLFCFILFCFKSLSQLEFLPQFPNTIFSRQLAIIYLDSFQTTVHMVPLSLYTGEQSFPWTFTTPSSASDRPQIYYYFFVCVCVCSCLSMFGVLSLYRCQMGSVRWPAELVWIWIHVTVLLIKQTLMVTASSLCLRQMYYFGLITLI